MKIRPIYFILSLLLFINVLHAKDKNSLERPNNKICFTENRGQFADQNYRPRPDVLFGGSDGQLTFHITRKGISYQLYRVDSYKEIEDPKTKEKQNEIDQQSIYRTDIKWLNANPNPVVKTDEALQGYDNYYLEQCPNGALNVKSYKGITLLNIYNNIDLHYYEKEGHLKYDYIVAPHANYKEIQLKVEGATLILQNDGSLIIETPFGKIQEQAPKVYQNGKQLEARYTITNNTIGFDVENYNSNDELIIDPVTRLWGTYYGGSGDDFCTSTKVDALGNVYMAGHSGSNAGTVIATTGSYQNVFGGGAFDAYLVKFSGSGLRLWGTYYGGIGSDFATCCNFDASGNLYMVGYTSSSTGVVMATSGSYQSTYGGGTYDAYMVQFNSSGVRLWATYYGGAGTDVGEGCSIDASGNVYMAGYTAGNTGTVIVTSGSHQNAYGGGAWDAYLVKFNSGGVRDWATYYGDTGDDLAYSCTTDASGNIYLAGYSTSSGGGTVIATSGSHQNANNGGNDGFLVKFNGSGIRQWATFYGGTANDYIYSCATDVSGNIFIAGHTASNSGTVIASVGSHQSTFGGGWDIFVVKFDINGVRSWGTYYGDSGTDCCWSCSTDGPGNVYLAGYAYNSTGAVIATPGSHQTTYGGGNYDAYLVKFLSNGVREWGTYYGGTGDDNAASCAIDGSGNVYMTGSTNYAGGTVIATAGSHQSILAGSRDAFLVNFFDCITATPAVNGPVCAGATLSLTANISRTATPGYSWTGPNSFTAAVQNPSIGGLSVLNVGIYTLTINDGVCIHTSTTQVNVINSLPSITVNSGSICSGNSFAIIPAGANTYTVSGGSFTVSPNITSSYSVSGTSTAGCVSSSIVSTVTVYAIPIPTLTVNSGSICSGNSFVIIPGGANTYSVTSGNFTVSPNITSSYSVTGTNTAGCVSSNVVGTITVYTTPTLAVNSGSICSGSSVTIIPSGANSYTITGGNYSVSPITTTSYSLSGTSIDGCVSSNAVSTITVYTIPTIAVNSGSICSGNSFTITPTGANTYTVTGGNFTVSPNTTSSYSVTGANTAGCVSSNIVSTVNVHATPTLVVNSGSICSGNSFTIIPSGASSYTITGSNYTVSPVTTTSYSLSGTNIDGCVSNAVSTIMVYSIPTIAVNSGSICFGNSFAIAPAGANTYTVTGGNFTVSPNSTSSYSVTGTSVAGCISSGTAVCTVSVNTIPTISVNSGSICSGNSFTIVPSGASTYSITGGSYTVSPSITSSYSVTGSSIAGCVSSNAVSFVTVHATPTLAVNGGSICLGEGFIITPSGANTYTITGGNFTVSPSTTTSYSVIGMSSEGCISEEAQSSVAVDICTGLNENSRTENGSVKIYPNPSSGVLHIESTRGADVLVIDLQGRLVFKFNISNGANLISIEQINSGVYFMEVFDSQGKHVFRVIKQ